MQASIHTWKIRLIYSKQGWPGPNNRGQILAHAHSLLSPFHFRSVAIVCAHAHSLISPFHICCNCLYMLWHARQYNLRNGINSFLATYTLDHIKSFQNSPIAFHYIMMDAFVFLIDRTVAKMVNMCTDRVCTRSETVLLRCVRMKIHALLYVCDRQSCTTATVLNTFTQCTHVTLICI
jgi:hypothetical protein